jgi:hypothetical protein
MQRTQSSVLLLKSRIYSISWQRVVRCEVGQGAIRHGPAELGSLRTRHHPLLLRNCVLRFLCFNSSRMRRTHLSITMEETPELYSIT